MKNISKRIMSVLLSLIMLVGLTASFFVSASYSETITGPAVLSFDEPDAEYRFIPDKSDYYNFRSSVVEFGNLYTLIYEDGGEFAEYVYIEKSQLDVDKNYTCFDDYSYYLEKGKTYVIISNAYRYNAEPEECGHYFVSDEFIPHTVTVTDNAWAIEPENIELYLSHFEDENKIFVGEEIYLTAYFRPLGSSIRFKNLEITSSDENVICIAEPSDPEFAQYFNEITLLAVGRGTAAVTVTDPESGVTSEIEITVNGSFFEYLIKQIRMALLRMIYFLRFLGSILR